MNSFLSPELLAPAGNEVCLHAAVRGGADAVYLGLDDFNARRGADNFTLDSLKRACDWAHVRGVRIFLTLNIAILPSEVARALKHAHEAVEAGVDAIIVQDVGFAATLAHQLPAIEIHISTQMNTHNRAGIEAAAALGASRVTLAREIQLEEMRYLCGIAHGLGLEIEAFAHGALCVCYSGQCFMSSLVGGRSANRGMCAQACRLPYELHNASVRKALDAPGEHLLSPKDLALIGLVPQLVEAGVDSFKIEGRMKSPEYVYTVTSVYREALDALGSTKKLSPQAVEESSEADTSASANSAQFVASVTTQRLEEVFSRGFTTAYAEGITGREMMSYTRPNNRGVRVGRVAEVRDGMVEIDCEVPLVEGDVIEFWTNKGHFAHTVSALEQRQKGRVACVVAKPVGRGDRVFRVRSAEATFVDSAYNPRVPITARVELRTGKPARLSLSTTVQKGRAIGSHRVCTEGPLVEKARTKALSAEEVRNHINRFGNTPFELVRLDVELDEGVGMSFSTLHHLRADAAEALSAHILNSFKKERIAQSGARDVLFFPSRVQRRQLPLQLCAWATNPACARAARKAGAHVIYVPALNYKRGEATVAGQRSSTVETAGYPKQSVVALPVVNHDLVAGTRETAHGFDPWKYTNAGKPVLAENLGDVFRARAEGMQVEVGPHIPVTNELSAQYFAEFGVLRIWLSPELSLGQIQRIAEHVDVPLGLFISGAAELMVTEYCILQSQGPCNQDCEVCPRRTTPHYLKDRKGYEMPVVTDCCGRSHIYNAVALDLVHVLPDLVGAGISAFMLDTSLLTVKETYEVVARAVRALKLYEHTGDALSKYEGTTTGHLFRGVQ